jgi:hypothetical protein
MIESKINEYLADLPADEFIYKRNGPGYKKGDANKNKLDDRLNAWKTPGGCERVRPVPAYDASRTAMIMTI